MNAPSASNSWLGQSVGEGRYQLQERLGGGSMGDVFIALDTRIGQIVAIKILKSHWAETEELRRRFEHEVALCAALKSEHIVQIRDYGVTSDGYPYYVMEYLTGQTLGDLMRQQERLPIEQAVNFVMQICSGLERAHAGITLPNRGETIKVVHRDLKPDNIFIAETSIGALIKILDFGIAKIQNMQRDSTSATNMFIGTFHYASPEQVEVSKQLDGRSDIYSLGIILYEMLSGSNPFGLDPASGEISQMTWAVAHASKPAIPLRSQPGCDRFSPQLEAVVMRCLEKNPQDRFATVQELRQALQAALQSDSLPTSGTIASGTRQSETLEATVARNSSSTHSSSITAASQSPLSDISPAHSRSAHSRSAHSQSTHVSPRPVADSPAAEPAAYSEPKPESRSSSPDSTLIPWSGRSPLFPIAAGFLGAIGVSGLLLWRLLPQPSPQVPAQEPTTAQTLPYPTVSLPTLVCNEPPVPTLSGKPALEQQGFQYYGKLENNQFAGRGTVIFSGFRYDGEFQNGKKQGCGRLAYPPNHPTYQEYVGQFQNDFPNGLGTLVFSNGAKYIGQFKTESGNPYCQGEGVLILNSGEQIGGTWEKGVHQESQGKYSCNALPSQPPV